MSSLRMRSALFLGVALLALGCSGSDSTGPSTGNVQVSASTTGADLDPDGYTVAVDGGAGRSLAVNGTVTFSQLSAGDHTVTLSGIAARYLLTWSALWTLNRDRIADPDLIYPGQVLRVPPAPG